VAPPDPKGFFSSMAKQTIQVAVEQLKLGVYVSALDRPWSGTPFLFQGFEIESDDELKQLQSLCRTVFIDVPAEEVEQIRSTTRRLVAEKRAPAADAMITIPRNLVTHLEKVVVKDPVPLKKELSEAKAAFGSARQSVTTFFDRLKKGGTLDVPHIQGVVDSMVESVFRNREAMSWLARLKSKDDYLYSHSLAASVWSIALGRHLGLDKETLRVLGTGAMLLDVGKTRLPTELLNKPVKPDEAEWKTLRGHVEAGLELVRATNGVDARVLTMIETHHERFDGSGYPAGLTGDAIPMVGRIGGLVDCYDAMISERRYASARSTYDAVRELKRVSGTWFQPELVELFVQAVGVFPSGSLIELNTGEVGVVVAQNRFRRLRPQIMLILDANKKLYADFAVIDLNTCEINTASGQPGLWITKGLEPGAYGIDPTEYFL
jgi:HD-GYP domain-containing protein (c-di-GMP phosphodiesterase class II)